MLLSSLLAAAACRYSTSGMTQTRRLPANGLRLEVGDDGLDLLDADEVALALDHVQVRVHAAARALALGAGAAPAAGGDERDAQLARERGLGEALRAGEQVGVADSAARASRARRAP